MFIAQDEDGHEKKKKNTQQLLLYCYSLQVWTWALQFFIFYVNYIALWFCLP